MTPVSTYTFTYFSYFFFFFPMNRENQTFAATRPSSVLLEQLAVCVAKGEPVLLVGETGTGKTSTVQHLARVTGELRSPGGLCLPACSSPHAVLNSKLCLMFISIEFFFVFFFKKAVHTTD